MSEAGDSESLRLTQSQSWLDYVALINRKVGWMDPDYARFREVLKWGLWLLHVTLSSRVVWRLHPAIQTFVFLTCINLQGKHAVKSGAIAVSVSMSTYQRDQQSKSE